MFYVHALLYPPFLLRNCFVERDITDTNNLQEQLYTAYPGLPTLTISLLLLCRVRWEPDYTPPCAPTQHFTVDYLEIALRYPPADPERGSVRSNRRSSTDISLIFHHFASCLTHFCNKIN